MPVVFCGWWFHFSSISKPLLRCLGSALFVNLQFLCKISIHSGIQNTVQFSKSLLSWVYFPLVKLIGESGLWSAHTQNYGIIFQTFSFLKFPLFSPELQEYIFLFHLIVCFLGRTVHFSQNFSFLCFNPFLFFLFLLRMQ